MKFEQTHWLWMPTVDIEVMVRDGRVYDVNNGADLGSVDTLKLRPIRFFYMIRKTGTDHYHGNWTYLWLSLELAHKWWHDDGLKEATQRCEYLCGEHCACEIVKFEYEEKP